jgi:hypothetical protein
MLGEVECFGEVNEEGGETKWMDNDPRLGAFDELLRTSMDISNRQTRLFNEAKDKGYQRGYFLQLAGRLLGREMMILGFVIVPRLPENPSVSEVSAWNSSHPKEYKVRIIDMKHEVIDHVILPDSPQTWRDLDGTNVEFRSDFRPRARYLYFNYCVQILKVSWKPGKHREMGEAIQMELGRHFWGTPGRYLPREMLMAFVEEMGHEYEQLLEGAMEDGAADADADADSDLLLAAASDEVKASAQGVQIDSDEDDESDYEDAENSDEDY